MLVRVNCTLNFEARWALSLTSHAYVLMTTLAVYFLTRDNLMLFRFFNFFLYFFLYFFLAIFFGFCFDFFYSFLFDLFNNFYLLFNLFVCLFNLNFIFFFLFGDGND